jgi:peptidoglycan/LPS O-acetylase OafA/YrhL
MKPFLVITQAIYALCLVAWLFVWFMSFMLFDNGTHLWNSLIFLLISLFPIAVVGSSITAWILRSHRRQTAIAINLIPILWIVPFVVFIATY